MKNIKSLDKKSNRFITTQSISCVMSFVVDAKFHNQTGAQVTGLVVSRPHNQETSPTLPVIGLSDRSRYDNTPDKSTHFHPVNLTSKTQKDTSSFPGGDPGDPRRGDPGDPRPGGPVKIPTIPLSRRSGTPHNVFNAESYEYTPFEGNHTQRSKVNG